MMKKKKKKKKMEKEGINEGEEDEDAEVTKEKYGIAGGLKMDRRRAAGCELFDGVERGGGAAENARRRKRGWEYG